MNIDRQLIATILKDGIDSYRKVIERNIHERIEDGDAKKAFDFIIEHRKQYDQIPTREILISSIEVSIPEAGNDVVEVLIDKILQRHGMDIALKTSLNITNLIVKRDLDEISNVIGSAHKELQRYKLNDSTVIPLWSLGDKVIERYERVKNGEKGIEAPWQSMTDATLGWWKRDLILVAGKSGLGKTWLALMSCLKAWKSGKKVLIVSTEMDEETLYARLFAIESKLPYWEIRAGQLDDFLEAKFKKGVAALKDSIDLWVIGSDFDFTMDALEAAVEETEAEIVCVDGVYLIKGSAGKSRHEEVSSNFDDLKRIGIRRDCVMLATMQFNRNAKSAQVSTIDASNIAMTDTSVWHAAGIFGLYQTEEMKRNKQMGCKCLKSREGEARDFIFRWDFTAMEFSEISSDGQPVASTMFPGADNLDDIPF